jgi:hypothetical protein
MAETTVAETTAETAMAAETAVAPKAAAGLGRTRREQANRSGSRQRDNRLTQHDRPSSSAINTEITTL